MGPHRPRETSAAKAIRAGTRASGARRGGPPKRGPARRAETPSRSALGRSGWERSGLQELERLHARRLRACRSLGIPVPSEAASGPPENLLQRIAQLDRRIEVSLDLAGGRYFPPWNDPDEEDPDTGPEDPEDPDGVDEQPSETSS